MRSPMQSNLRSLVGILSVLLCWQGIDLTCADRSTAAPINDVLDRARLQTIRADELITPNPREFA